MKRLMLVLAMALFMGYSATAQISDPAYQGKVTKLVKMKMDKEDLLNSVVERLKKFGVSISEDKQKDFRKEMSAEIEKLQSNVVSVYLKTYTKKEVDALLNFYTSSVGQSILDKQSELDEKKGELFKDFMKKAMPIVQKYM